MPINSSNVLQISNALRRYFRADINLLRIRAQSERPNGIRMHCDWNKNIDKWVKNMECRCEQFIWKIKVDELIQPAQCSLFLVNKIIHRSCIFISDHHRSMARMNAHKQNKHIHKQSHTYMCTPSWNELIYANINMVIMLYHVPTSFINKIQRSS